MPELSELLRAGSLKPLQDWVSAHPEARLTDAHLRLAASAKMQTWIRTQLLPAFVDQTVHRTT
jgi:hypothetical protein